MTILLELYIGIINVEVSCLFLTNASVFLCRESFDNSSINDDSVNSTLRWIV